MKFMVYVHRASEEFGPYSADEVIEYLYEGNIEWTDSIREDGSSEWSTMEQTFDLEEIAT